MHQVRGYLRWAQPAAAPPSFAKTSRSRGAKAKGRQYEAALASVNNFTKNYQTIATAYADYSKKAFEDTSAFVEKLSGVKSLDKALEVQTEFAKSAYETFVAESQKIAGLYSDLAKQTYKPLEGLVAKFSPATAA